MKEKLVNKQASDLPNISAPAQRALANAGIKNLSQLVKFTEAEIKQLHGIGPNTLVALKAALKAKGMLFAKK